MQSSVIFTVSPPASRQGSAVVGRRDRTRQALARLQPILQADQELNGRFRKLMSFANRVRTSEYHLTNACNIRCEGCWFFEQGHDRETREVTDLAAWETFVKAEREEKRITTALIIGGEPTLFPDRLLSFVRHMKHVTVSSNGLKALPREGFENVAIGLTLFGGGPLDDKLRAIKVNGSRFDGLFDKVLENYRNDPRAAFVYALTEDGIEYIDETVRRIQENGNSVTFNFYSRYGTTDPAAQSQQAELLAEALRVKEKYPVTVLSHPYFIRTLITGRSHWDAFGYDNCPSISESHPAHAARLENGNPTLRSFNAWSADLKTVKFCCTGGHCNGCRDSQAMFSWLLVSMDQFCSSPEEFATWVDVAESYWSQFVWSPFHKLAKEEGIGTADKREALEAVA